MAKSVTITHVLELFLVCVWVDKQNSKFKLCHRILTGRYAASQIALWEDSGSRLEPWTGDPEPEETDVVTLSL